MLQLPLGSLVLSSCALARFNGAHVAGGHGPGEYLLFQILKGNSSDLLGDPTALVSS